MDWRRIYFCVFALLLLSPRLAGQGAAVSPQPAVTVLGDVARPGKFAVQPESTVRAAIAGATSLGDSINVTILRQGQQRAQWSRAIRMSAADSSERVLDGDILLVESLSPLAQQPARNAVVRGGGAATVVSLEDNGVTVNDVLVGLGISAGPGTRLALSARLRSQPPLNPASLSTVVQHGDVITVSQSDPSLDQPTGERANTAAVRPAYSEWGAGGGAVQAPPVPPVPNMFAASAGQSNAGSAAASTSPTFGGVPPLPPGEPGVDSAAVSGGVVTEAPSSQGVFGPPGLPPAVPDGDGRELMTLEEQLQSSPIAGELSTHGQAARSVASAPPAVARSQQVTVPAPTAPAGTAGSRAAEVVRLPGSAGNQLLNGFVVAALLLSGCWVMAKSVTVSGRAVSERVQEVSAAPVTGPIPQMSQALFPPPPTAQAVMAPPPTAQPATAQPVVMAAVCEPPFAAGPPVSAGGFSILRTEPCLSSVSHVTGLPGTASAAAAGGPDGLEDLLRNQVPVEASAVRLPPGVQIYGRPNRPQVLRLDPPQSVTAGPHFVAGERQGRSDVVHEGVAGETATEQRLSRLARPLRGVSGNLRG